MRQEIRERLADNEIAGRCLIVRAGRGFDTAMLSVEYAAGCYGDGGRMTVALDPQSLRILTSLLNEAADLAEAGPLP